VLALSLLVDAPVKRAAFLAMVTMLLPMTSFAGAKAAPRSAGHGNKISAMLKRFQRFPKRAEGNGFAPRPKPRREYRADDPEIQRTARQLGMDPGILAETMAANDHDAAGAREGWQRRPGLLLRMLGRGASQPTRGAAKNGRHRAPEPRREYRADDPEIQRTARQLGMDPGILAETMEINDRDAAAAQHLWTRPKHK